MTPEQIIKESLDGSFWSICEKTNQVTRKAVSVDFVPRYNMGSVYSPHKLSNAVKDLVFALHAKGFTATWIYSHIRNKTSERASLGAIDRLIAGEK